MEFIDNTGHVFSLPTYNDNPIALKYKEHDYIFWLKENNISVNNYYIKPIRFIIPVTDIYNININQQYILNDFNIEISIDSQFYRLIDPKTIQSKIESNESLLENIEITFETDCKKILTNNDFYIDNYGSSLIVTNNDNTQYVMFPFYVIGKSTVEGTYLSQIMIKTSLEDDITYTPIMVGGVFVDECEQLIINGKNMGIRLPKEILKAIYSSPFDAKYSDEIQFKNKMKELLMNYMSIKGECGNFKSVYNSLKWFEWGKYINISKLIKTDNEFKDQYILDYFSIDNDIKDTFSMFNTTNMISLSVPENIETGEIDEQNYDNMFIGEGKPLLEDLFSKNVEVIHDDLSFYQPYYRFMFIELALKLDCLKYYYQNYFLPVHIAINRASIDRKVYANTIKMLSFAYTKNTEEPIYIPQSSIYVEWPNTHKLLFCKTQHYIDSKFNEFSIYNNDHSEELYWIDENCITLPIKIVDSSNLYTEYEYGDYIYNNDKYYKIYNLFENIDNQLVLTNDLKKATHFKLTNNESTTYILSLYKRYKKISSGYFKCVLIFSYILKKQSNTGKYVFIDNKYQYKEKFYENEYIQTPNDLGCYIDYYGKRIYVDPQNRYDIEFKILEQNNSFEYYQDANNYYINFIILPRYYSVKYPNIDWINGEFRVSLLVNDKWFNYDFTVILPTLYLEFGRLYYRYYIDDNNVQETYHTMFKQIMSIDGDDIKFNSFMYQPDLVSINSLFYDTDNEKLLTFIDKLIENHYEESLEANTNKIYEFYKKYYQNSIQVPYNKFYFNKVHIFKIYSITGGRKTLLEYDLENYDIHTNSGKSNFYNLYSGLFDIETYNFIFQIQENIDYDVYLMHDDANSENKAYWYLVFISKLPVGYYDNEEDLSIHRSTYQTYDYLCEYSGISIEKFLVNRMDIIPSNGLNQFNYNTLIAVGVYNNDYQYNIDLTNKLLVNKVYDPYKLYEITSNSNLMIITNNDNYDGYYEPGYYNVQLNYTINGINGYSGKINAVYKVNNSIEQINYPIQKEEVNYIDSFYTISSLKILYEHPNFPNNQYTSQYIIDPSEGFIPIGIQVINEGYFVKDVSPEVYIGLKVLDTNYPDTGNINKPSKYPWFGFWGVTNVGTENDGYLPIFGLTEGYNHIVKKSNGYINWDKDIYVQGDSSTILKSSSKKEAPNDRYWFNSSNSNNINILNDDDSLNKTLLDESCALFDWDGQHNSQLFYKCMREYDNEQYEEWWNPNVKKLTNKKSSQNDEHNHYSPVMACAWRYHTLTTHYGQWYIPSFAEIMFMSYNFLKISNKVIELAKSYKNDVSIELLTMIGNSGMWSSTCSHKPNTTTGIQYDIHPATGKAHIITKDNNWLSIPFINTRELNIINLDNN